MQVDEGRKTLNCSFDKNKKNEGMYRTQWGEGRGEKSLLSQGQERGKEPASSVIPDPSSELQLGTRERKSAKITEAMKSQLYYSYEYTASN